MYYIVHPYYKGSTDKTAVVYTIGVYGYMYILICDVYVHVYMKYQNAYVYSSDMMCMAGQLEKIICLCLPWHQSSQASLTLVCRVTSTLLILTKDDQRAEPGSGWAPAELNHILQAHVVDGALSTFGCVEWESEGVMSARCYLCRGVMCARCYPFDMPKHCFHGMNPKVMYIHSITLYTHVYT